MKPVTVYVKDYCPYCKNAKNLLNSKGIPFTEIDITHKPDEYEKLKSRSGMKTVPQIFFGERLIGGFDDLSKLNSQEDLLALLAD